MEFYGIDILDIWRGEISYFTAAMYLQHLLRKNSVMASLVNSTSLTQTDSLLVDILNEMNALRYYTSVVAQSKFKKAKHWKAFIKNSPPLIEKPSNQPPKPKQKPKITHGRDVFRRLHAIMRRKMITSGLNSM